MTTIRDYGITIGTMPTGPCNRISDVPGVIVGHATMEDNRFHTGVTVILPAGDNVFSNKLTAAAFVHNGFGKTAGLVQIDELGTIETPIALTNTLNVGVVHDALVRYSVERCQKENVPIRSVNPVVGECNDSHLSDICGLPITSEHLFAAIGDAKADFSQGSVGAGTGTVCFGLKGGIGSASRIMEIGGKTYTLGVLVQSNYGATHDLVVDGRHIGRDIEKILAERKTKPASVDAGSIIMVVATDLPVSDRQLRRIIRRCGVGLANTGSVMGHGSGEIMIGFTTANRVPMDGKETRVITILREDLLDIPFRAAAEATEEAVLNSMAASDTTVGYTGETVWSIREFL